MKECDYNHIYRLKKEIQPQSETLCKHIPSKLPIMDNVTTFGVGSSWSRVIKLNKHIRRLYIDPHKRESFQSMD